MASNKANVASVVEKLATPVASNLGLDIWNVEFVKEGSSYFLRIFIDKEDGVSIDDCEAMSRAIDKVLDDADPIEQSYCLEVSSPGIERSLKKESQFKKYIGEKIKVKLFKPDENGRRELEGTLLSFDDGAAEIKTADETVIIKLSQAAYFKTCDDYDSITEE